MSFFLNWYDPAASGFMFVGGTTGGGSSISYSVDLTSIGIQAGDIVIVASGFTGNGIAAGDITCSGNNNGSYSLNSSTSEGTDSWDTGLRIFYKVQGGTPDTSLSIGRGASGWGGATAVHVWRGVHASPIDTTGTAVTGTNTGRGNPPAITPTNTGAVILACGIGAQSPGGSAYTVPSGMGNAISAFNDNASVACGVFIASFAWTSGSYDPASWTGGSDSTSASWCSNTIAIRPA